MFWLVDWNWSGPRTNPYVCVDDVVRLGVELLRGCQFFFFFFFLAERLKLPLSGRESSLVQTFVNLVNN